MNTIAKYHFECFAIWENKVTKTQGCSIHNVSTIVTACLHQVSLVILGNLLRILKQIHYFLSDYFILG